MKYASMVVTGVIANSLKDHKRGNLFVQRAVNKGGDSVLITSDDDKGEKTTYIVPTQFLKDLLNEPI